MTFPIELWIKIAEFCTNPTLISLRCICSALSEIVLIDSQLVIGMQDRRDLGRQINETRIICAGYESLLSTRHLEQPKECGLEYWLRTMETVKIHLRGSDYTEAPRILELCLNAFRLRTKGPKIFDLVIEPISEDLTRHDTHVMGDIISQIYGPSPHFDAKLTIRYPNEDTLYNYNPPEIVNATELEQMTLGTGFTNLSMNMFFLEKANFRINLKESHQLRHINLYSDGVNFTCDCDRFIKFLKQSRIYELDIKGLSVTFSTPQQIIDFTTIPIEGCILRNHSFCILPELNTPIEWPVKWLKIDYEMPERFLNTFSFSELQKVVLEIHSTELFSANPTLIKGFLENLESLVLQWEDWKTMVTSYQDILSSLVLKQLVIQIKYFGTDRVDLRLIDLRLLKELEFLKIYCFGTLCPKYESMECLAESLAYQCGSLRHLDLSINNQRFCVDIEREANETATDVRMVPAECVDC